MNTLQSILAGIGAEFFTYGKKVFVTYKRQQYELNDAPEVIKNTLKNYLDNHPDKARAYRDMAGESGMIEQCVRCLFANLDGSPDITDDGILIPEFVECSQRPSCGGTCKWEGIGCLLKAPCEFGLSDREQEIASLAHLTNKEIAEELFISQFTVSTHLQNVQRKMGVRNKKQIIKIRPSIWRQQ